MDAYPSDYIVHNLPLILLSGLGSDPEALGPSKPDDLQYPRLRENGVQIFSDIPALTGSAADQLLDALLNEDASEAPWNSRSDGGGAGGIGFRVKRVGRVGRHPFGAIVHCTS
jgi:hypothetical protein